MHTQCRTHHMHIAKGYTQTIIYIIQLLMHAYVHHYLAILISGQTRRYGKGQVTPTRHRN